MPDLRAIWALCVTTSNIYDLIFGNSGQIWLIKVLRKRKGSKEQSCSSGWTSSRCKA